MHVKSRKLLVSIAASKLTMQVVKADFNLVPNKDLQQRNYS